MGCGSKGLPPALWSVINTGFGSCFARHSLMTEELPRIYANLPPEVPIHEKAKSIVTELFPTTIHQYSPLESAAGEIRLISLLPGKRSDVLDCRVIHVSLTGHPTYKALSYTWGQPKSTCSCHRFSFRRIVHAFPIHDTVDIHVQPSLCLT